VPVIPDTGETKFLFIEAISSIHALCITLKLKSSGILIKSAILNVYYNYCYSKLTIPKNNKFNKRGI